MLLKVLEGLFIEILMLPKALEGLLNRHLDIT
jgi:hypothetical protein